MNCHVPSCSPAGEVRVWDVRTAGLVEAFQLAGPATFLMGVSRGDAIEVLEKLILVLYTVHCNME